MRKGLSAIAVLLVLATLPHGLSAQEVEAAVTVSSEQISPALRDEVASFADDLKRYVEDTRWTDYNWEGDRLKMTFNVVFTGYSDGEFTAKLLVGSQRSINKSDRLSPMMKVLDEGWQFPYTRNQPFQREPNRYNDLTGLIDFYVYLALGFDLDSYDLFGGKQMFARAMDIAQYAQQTSGGGPWTTQAPTGAYSRYGLIRELSDIRYNPIRRFVYDYHYNGLDLLASNKAAALDSINNQLSRLVVTKNTLVEGSTILRVLTDAKNIELSELFVGFHDDTVWRKLGYIDPGHTTVYESAKNRRQ